MTRIPDLDPVPYNPDLHEGADTRSVGWLGDSVPASGAMSRALLEKLRRVVRRHSYSDRWMGFHTCEICNRAHGHGEIAIDHAGIRYVAPSLIVHYVEAHHYLPPEPFLEALRNGTPRSGDGSGYIREHARPSMLRRFAAWIRR